MSCLITWAQENPNRNQERARPHHSGHVGVTSREDDWTAPGKITRLVGGRVLFLCLVCSAAAASEAGERCCDGGADGSDTHPFLWLAHARLFPVDCLLSYLRSNYLTKYDPESRRWQVTRDGVHDGR